MFPYNIASAIMFAMGSIYILHESSTFPVDEFSDVNPASWPTFLAWIMLALSVMLLGETIVKRMIARKKAAGADTDLKNDPPPFDFTSRGMAYVYALCGIFAGFSALLHYINFTVASIFLIPCCMRLLGEKRLWMLAAVTTGVPIAVYVIFSRVLGIQMP